ncbi:hypothetical protein ACIA5D_46465 [Actinoplanes sp. NPDC051513]|uniref:hypothetical protein n=1 Tax=Actinoplanes sp. NPDC051513 TaxID=3363908 RepID=UPI0037A0F8A8
MDVLVVSRARGEWVMWRVGRQWLAWRPARYESWWPSAPPGYNSNPYSALFCLLATIVVLPWRAVTNRWPVICYVTVPFNVEMRMRRSRPMPRADADVVARRWAAYIERFDAPPPYPDDLRWRTGEGIGFDLGPDVPADPEVTRGWRLADVPPDPS